LGTDPNTVNNPEIATGLTKTSLDIFAALRRPLEEGTTYYWSVDASNGETYGSEVWSFTTYKIPVNLSGPYTVDEDTLHLWHLELQLDEFGYRWYLDSAFPDSNDPSVWTDLTAVYGVSRNSLPGFGESFDTDNLISAPAGAESQNVDPQSRFQGADGTFTYEAIIKVNDLTGPTAQ